MHEADHGLAALQRLLVIDQLEVGPIHLEPRRLVAPYTVTIGSRSESTEMSYRYEEDVFDPADRVHRNLATLMAAQVALNYGLFCRKMVFRGCLDRYDRRFLEDMARNTAREIYVNKLLAENPFLGPEATGLPIIKLDNYVQAELVFENEAGWNEQEPLRRAGPVDRSRHVILSSGGKESLLSFALLREMGYQADPIFVNESGRHWFTALNAYRHFTQQVPGTARVWTSSDRVFSWMLRQLSFIRQDFARVRSDDYPIRLWTVAVFLFGTLPLAFKRGAGRLVIGDEFDTTLRSSFHGIPHYNGLYDQSRYFDNALTRYFQRKGWALSQFSLLRPLSELMIEKVLVERYPNLQELQVSCHASHADSARARPCGRCEKCRRVMAMLLSLDADPTRCGYTQQQISECLRALPERRLHHEAELSQQIGYMLAEKNLLPSGVIGGRRPRQHPEVMKLRFEPERSPMDSVPTELRKPLYTILLEHADGAAKRSGRIWADFDLLNDPALLSPFTFESPSSSVVHDPSRGPERDYVLGELTWPRAKARLAEVDIALLPVGSLEQHGPHLPLDVDAFDAQHLAHRVAEACSEPRPLVLPLVPFGVSYHHDDFSGTISISPETLSRVVYEVGMGAARHGITKLVIINGHGGNSPALHFAAQMINRDARIFTCVDSGETSDADIYSLAETENDVHAGEIETSATLATRPDLVNIKAARRSVPTFSSRYLDFSSKRCVGWYAYTKKISQDGTMGDPTKATLEKGQRFWQLMIDHLTRFVEELKSLSLDEIYHRQY